MVKVVVPNFGPSSCARKLCEGGAETNHGRGRNRQRLLRPVPVTRVLRVLGVVVLLPPRVLIFFVLRLPRVHTLRVPRGRFARLRARAARAVQERGRGERQEEN